MYKTDDSISKQVSRFSKSDIKIFFIKVIEISASVSMIPKSQGTEQCVHPQEHNKAMCASEKAVVIDGFTGKFCVYLNKIWFIILIE